MKSAEPQSRTSPGIRRALPLALAALILAALALPTLASADGRFGVTENDAHDLTAHVGPGGLDSPQGVAVSSAEGNDVYVVDANENQRVAQFEPDGTFVRAFGWGIVPGSASATAHLIEGSTSASALTTAGRFRRGEIVEGPGIRPGTEIAVVLPDELQLSKPATETRSSTLTATAGPGNVPVNEVQELSVKATSGTLRLTFTSPDPGGTVATTGELAVNGGESKPSAAELQASLEALPNIGSGNVSVSGGPADATGSSPYLIEFEGKFADTDVRALEPVDLSLAGGSPSSGLALSTPTQGGGVLETCTTVCVGASFEEGRSAGDERTAPGQLSYDDAIAVDNSCAEQEPPLTGSACESFDPSYGDVYIVNQRSFRIEQYSPAGEFLLMFGGEVDKTTGADFCTAADLQSGDECGAGVSGTGPAQFYNDPPGKNNVVEGRAGPSWAEAGSSSIAVGPDGNVYVGDYGRIQEFKPDGSFAAETAFPAQQFVGSLVVDEAGIYALGTPVGEQQKLPIPHSGTFTLEFEGERTAPLQWVTSPFPQFEAGNNATHIQEALEGLAKIGPKAVSVFISDEDTSHAFVSFRADKDVPQLVDSFGPVETLRNGAPDLLVQLAPGGGVLRTLDAEPGQEPTHIALGPGGKLFVSDYANRPYRADEGGTGCGATVSSPTCPEEVFRTFKPDGSLSAEFSSPQVVVTSKEARFHRPPAIAIGSAHAQLYAPAEEVEALEPAGNHRTFEYIATIDLPTHGPPTVEGERSDELEPNRATLHATVNPREFETHYRFQFITADRCTQNEAAGHECFLGAEEQPPAPGANLGQVYRRDPQEEVITGLLPETSYRWRAVAFNSEGETEGPTQSLETLPATLIRGFSTKLVGPELVTIDAELNPNHSLTSDRYTICIGADTSYADGCVKGSLPAAGGGFQPVEATFEGLGPNTEYHYHLLTESEFGDAESPDEVLTTEPSAAEEHAAELAECANVTRREEDSSTALPDCRSYEQVSEHDKRGGDAFPIFSLAPSGERVLYESPSAFDGAQQDNGGVEYLAQRTASGWQTRPVIEPIAPSGTEAVSSGSSAEHAYSPELDRWLFPEIAAHSYAEAFFSSSSDYLSMGTASGGYVLHASPNFELQEGIPRPYYEYAPFDIYQAAADLSRFYIRTDARLLPAPADERPDGYAPESVDNPPNASDRIYEVAGVGGPDPTITLIAELPSGLSPYGTGCAIEPHDRHVPWSHGGVPLVSTDGMTVVFPDAIEKRSGANCVPAGGPNPTALFVHRSGAPSSVEVSASPSQCHAPHPCSGAVPATPVLDGLSPDGRRVWFTTTQPLIDADGDESGGDLYLARLSAAGALEELVLASAGEATASHPVPGEGAGVLGAARMSPDGTHLAYLATGVLTEVPNANGDVAQPGAENLYVYDAETEETKFVATLGPTVRTGGPWSIPSSEAAGFFKFNRDGRYLVFPTAAQLTADDTDTATDVYRYDFATGRLIRLSFGRNGNDGNGNDDAYGAGLLQAGAGTSEANEPAEDTGRSISADGRRVIFETSAALVSQDTNNANDVYEWEEAGVGSCHQGEDLSGGCVRLVSDGVDPHGVDYAVISSSGRDIAFHTHRGEVGWDTDGVGDVYDAREGGGFPRPAEHEIPCEKGSAESCHGESTRESLHPAYTSEELRHSPEGNRTRSCAKGRHRVKKGREFRCVPNRKSKHHRKHRHHKHAQKQSKGGRK